MNLSKEYIQEKLSTSDKWLNNGIVALWRRQTRDERDASLTRHDNNRGFNVPDSGKLSSFAMRIVWARKQGKTESECLTPRQKYAAKIQMKKYANQLIRIANGQ